MMIVGKDGTVSQADLDKFYLDRFNSNSHLYRSERKFKVAILDSLASNFIITAKSEKDKRKRDDLFKHATKVFNKADSLDNQETITWIGKSVMHLYKENIQSASPLLKNILRDNPDSRIARIGLAICHFHGEKFEDALKELTQVMISILQYPKTRDADLSGIYSGVRYAIGLLWSRLNNEKKAIEAFQLQLEQTPKNDKVLAALGVLLLNRYVEKLSVAKYEEDKLDAMEDFNQAIKYFSEAYNINSSNALASNHLSSYFFTSTNERDYKKISNLALKAHHSTTNSKIRAESLYYLGRSSHDQGNYEDAFKHYSDATLLNPSFLLPFYGMGQIYIQRNQFPKAIECFQKVYEKYPDNPEVNRSLAYLYAKTDQPRAQKHIERALKTQSTNPSLWVEYADLLEQFDFKKCCEAYSNAYLCYEDKSKVPYQLWNNMGAVRSKMGQYDLAKDGFLRALIKNTYASYTSRNTSSPFSRSYSIEDLIKMVDSTPIDEPLGSQVSIAVEESLLEVLGIDSNVTMVFNIGKIYEDMGLTDKAIEIFQNIIDKHPTYLDCLLRQVCIYRSTDKDKALEILNRILEINPNHVDAKTLLANIQLENKDYQSAQNIYDDILKKDKTDVYSIIQLANISLRAAFKEQEIEKKEKYIRRATAFFSQALKLSPNSIYAANGIGIVMMYRKMYVEATDAFLSIREAVDYVPDIWINLGHSFLQRKNYSSAINIYERCIKKWGENHPSIIENNILVYMGQAYFHNGIFETAKEYFNKALELNPDNDDIWYDYATICKDYALNILNSERDEATVKSQRLASEALQIAGPIFERLSAPSTQRRNFSLTKCKRNHILCTTNVELAQEKLLEIEQQEKSMQEQREKALKEEEEFIQKQKEKEEEISRQKEEEMKRLEEEAIEMNKRMEEYQKSWTSKTQV